MTARQRQGNHVKIRDQISPVQAPDQGHGEHEQVDEKQVGRKCPGRRPQVALPHVLDGQHMKLAGQKDHG